LLKSLLNLPVGPQWCFASGYHHNVIAWFKAAAAKPADLSQASSKPIANHGAAHFFADTKAEAGGFAPCTHGVHNKFATGIALPDAKYLLEFPVSSKGLQRGHFS